MNIKAAVILFATAAYGQVNTWGQCGGVGYGGNTVCIAGAVCSTLNLYYAQCLPGGPATTTVVTTTRSTTSPIITTSSRTVTTVSLSTIRTSTSTSLTRSSTTTSRTTTSTPITTGGAGPGTTLISPYVWIRAVVDPYFHKYLQSSPLRSPGDAVMADYTTAGQFNIASGQLVQLIDTAGTLLYGRVEEKTSDSQNKLQLTWATSPGTYGSFSWSGDALIWSHPNVARQNNAAWLICTGAKLHVNLGAYGYMTPSGCSDATIHYYNGATAVN
ncbi:hypothetical protein H072_8894 [Dactylellina haptotyla CBS 200.50]|uniref:CBM1 domain-containing protein n=1 Tax=Dactylellina haptotyla (strain CBS 200.50) TaxID=1284197 RepID=S8BDW2_DACHA|nr:hypothetical protein H072_8894 [Dactylellina haptotyla CBS 200.50]